MAGRKKWRRLGLGCLGLILVAAFFMWMTGMGSTVVSLWKNGTIPSYLFPAPKRTYTATNEANLKALHTAILLYHDSEGQFPFANGWMDAIENRIRASDMSAEEAAKKLVRPDLSGKSGEFGYALNTKASGKYRDDVGPADTILIYESRQKQRNAVGDPAKDRDGMAITVGGALVKPANGG